MPPKNMENKELVIWEGRKWIPISEISEIGTLSATPLSEPEMIESTPLPDIVYVDINTPFGDYCLKIPNSEMTSKKLEAFILQIIPNNWLKAHGYPMRRKLRK